MTRRGVRPDLTATHRAKGVTHRPVMHMMAERYLDKEYAPENVAERCGISAERIKTIAAEIARVAFDEAFELDHEWADFRGETHKTMIGRPVSFHTMRGISAHSNGFQTARALHLLQILLGTVEVPCGFRFRRIQNRIAR
jgi:anaerobic selenocysteine-containing dehydrogenase